MGIIFRTMIACILGLSLFPSYGLADPVVDGSNTSPAVSITLSEQDSWREWLSTSTLPGESGRYKLGCDVLVNSYQEISGDVEIDLNGFSLNIQRSTVRVQTNCTLAISDSKCALERRPIEYVAPSGSSSSAAIIVDEGGSVIFDESVSTMDYGDDSWNDTTFLISYGDVTCSGKLLCRSKIIGKGSLEITEKGVAENVTSQDGSQVVLSGGEIGEIACESSSFIMDGGKLGFLEATGNASVDLKGGQIGLKGFSGGYEVDAYDYPVSLQPLGGGQPHVGLSGKIDFFSKCADILVKDCAHSDSPMISAKVEDAPYEGDVVDVALGDVSETPSAWASAGCAVVDQVAPGNSCLFSLAQGKGYRFAFSQDSGCLYVAAGSPEHSQGWGTASLLPSTGGKYRLSSDLIIDGEWTVTGAVELCLAGYDLVLGSSESEGAIKVTNGSSLTICGCQRGCLRSVNGWYSGSRVEVSGGATLTLSCDIRGVQIDISQQGCFNRESSEGIDASSSVVCDGLANIKAGFFESVLVTDDGSATMANCQMGDFENYGDSTLGIGSFASSVSNCGNGMLNVSSFDPIVPIGGSSVFNYGSGSLEFSADCSEAQEQGSLTIVNSGTGTVSFVEGAKVSVSSQSHVFNESTGTIAVKGGDISAVDETSDAAISGSEGGCISVEGGSICGSPEGEAISSRGGKVEISGGKISGGKGVSLGAGSEFSMRGGSICASDVGISLECWDPVDPQFSSAKVSGGLIKANHPIVSLCSSSYPAWGTRDLTQVEIAGGWIEATAEEGASVTVKRLKLSGAPCFVTPEGMADVCITGVDYSAAIEDQAVAGIWADGYLGQSANAIEEPRSLRVSFAASDEEAVDLIDKLIVRNLPSGGESYFEASDGLPLKMEYDPYVKGMRLLEIPLEGIRVSVVPSPLAIGYVADVEVEFSPENATRIPDAVYALTGDAADWYAEQSSVVGIRNGISKIEVACAGKKASFDIVVGEGQSAGDAGESGGDGSEINPGGGSAGGSGGAGGGSTAPSEPEGGVTENPDGSTTTTVTEDDGTSVETTVSEDEGVTTVVEKDGDGAVTSASATVTEAAVESAAGKAVELPMAPVEAASSEKAVEVKVEAPAGAKVAVPVAKAEGASSVAPGAVLVLVDAEGNETVLPKTANTGEALSAEIPGDCALKVVDASADFPDVASDDWYEEQGVADFVSARGVMTGVEVAPGSFEFQGDEPTNRGMFVTMLNRLEMEAKAVSGEGFADVPEDSWYEDSSAWAVEAGIATGYLDAEGNATFDGEGFVTREQMATFLFRYAEWLGLDTSARAEQEIEGVSDFAKDAVSWAVAEGLIKGDDGTGAIRPGDGATRAEAAAVVMRMIDLMA